MASTTHAESEMVIKASDAVPFSRAAVPLVGDHGRRKQLVASARPGEINLSRVKPELQYACAASSAASAHGLIFAKVFASVAFATSVS